MLHIGILNAELVQVISDFKARIKKGHTLDVHLFK